MTDKIVEKLAKILADLYFTDRSSWEKLAAFVLSREDEKESYYKMHEAEFKRLTDLQNKTIEELNKEITSLKRACSMKNKWIQHEITMCCGDKIDIDQCKICKKRYEALSPNAKR